jgi:hypothetical protein
MAVQNHVIHLENGRLAADTPPDAVRSLVGRALEHGGNGIVVHFHGGLVNYANGMATAESLHGEYLDAGAYPVFFVWESGLIETITNNLDQIRREEIFRLIWKRLVNIVLRKIGQSDTDRSFGVLPPIDDATVQTAIDRAVLADERLPLDQAEPAVPDGIEDLTEAERQTLMDELLLDPELPSAIEEISNGLRPPAQVEADMVSRAATVQGSSATLMDPRALDELVERPDPTSRGVVSTMTMIKAIVSIAARIIHRFTRGRDHGFHATVVEEILRGLYLANVGELIWTQIKQDTADAFGADETVHGGTAFLTALRDALGTDPPPHITLVGHSTGAVYISEFLDRVTEILPDTVRFGVVFEAPAATLAKAAATIESHSSRITGFRMFTMDDSHERQDRLVPVLYPHSLLYFVSGVVEPSADTPLVGMHRFYDPSRFPDGEFPAIKIVRDFVGHSDGAAWSVTAPEAPLGWRSEATTHTAFDYEDRPTLSSVKQIIRNGF